MNNATRTWMLENGFDPEQINAQKRYQDTALILASRHDEPDVVADLLAEGADINIRNMDGTNALWAACVAESFPIAELLLKHGVDIDNQNDNGASVLMYAASTGKAEWVKYLLAAGADPELRSLDDFTALELAADLLTLKALKAVAKK